MDNVIFRAGKYLLSGRLLGTRNDVHEVVVRYDVGRKTQTEALRLRVHEHLVLRRMTDEGLQALMGTPALDDMGRPRTRQAHTESLSIAEDAYAVLSDPITNDVLEIAREGLQHLGILHPQRPVRGTFGEAGEAFYVFMKSDPFRDITKIQKGTVTGVTGYYKGCAVVEADGETFWVPVEDSRFLDSKSKDLDYYFRQDYDHDGIPDSLTSLPSKPALKGAQSRGAPSSPQDNWQTQPVGSKIAGNLYALADIDMDDVSILKEPPPPKSKYTASGIRESSALEYHYFYQQLKPKLHGVSGPTIQDIANALVKGAPVEAMFLREADPEELKKAYFEAFAQVFPGVSPDLSCLPSGHHA